MPTTFDFIHKAHIKRNGLTRKKIVEKKENNTANDCNHMCRNYRQIDINEKRNLYCHELSIFD